MDTVISEMLKDYTINSRDDEKNAIKEIIQEIVLAGLARTNFFEKAAFYGGTALRIFYDLDRFSEDLDFSLLEPDKNFSLENYFKFIDNEARAYGLRLEISKKEKSKKSNIDSAFLKADTKEHILLFFPQDEDLLFQNKLGNIKIKFEIDINPPKGATYEYKRRMLPYQFQVRLYDESSLFAGEIHVILCREWKNRFKGRDLYDYVFYITRKTKVNLVLLKEKLVASNYIDKDFDLTIEKVKEFLARRFDEIDYESAKEDVLTFLKDEKEDLNWSSEFFKDITNELR